MDIDVGEGLDREKAGKQKKQQKLKSGERKSKEAEKHKTEGQRSRGAKKQRSRKSKKAEKWRKGNQEHPKKVKPVAREKTNINELPFPYNYPAPCGLFQGVLVEAACRLSMSVVS